MKIVLPALFVFSIGCFTACVKENLRANVRVEAEKIHSHIRAGDFDRLYEEASPRIRECYTSASFSERMTSLTQRLKIADPDLNFREVKEETEMSDFVTSSSDKFVEGIHAVGEENRLREFLVFKNDNGKLRLFAYRLLDVSQRHQDVRSNMIACAQSN